MDAIWRARTNYKIGKLNPKTKNCVPISFWQPDEKSSDINKRQIIEIAKNGGSRPNSRTHLLGPAFNRYINKKIKCYDDVFYKKIYRLAPHWFEKAGEKNKQKLIELAGSGVARPSQNKHPLAHALAYFTNKGNHGYNPVFKKKLEKLAPHWFINTAKENKKKY